MHGQLAAIVKKCFLCQGFAIDQIASGHLRIVAAIVTRAKIDWAFILLSLWKKNIEEVKTNPKKKTYLRIISFYLHKLGNYKGEMEFLFPPACTYPSEGRNLMQQIGRLRLGRLMASRLIRGRTPLLLGLLERRRRNVLNHYKQ